MKLTLRHGQLFDLESGNYFPFIADWNGHGDHDKTPIPKDKSLRFIPYQCECGQVLIDQHESNSFRD